jgi:hypothetical protein
MRKKLRIHSQVSRVERCLNVLRNIITSDLLQLLIIFVRLY